MAKLRKIFIHKDGIQMIKKNIKFPLVMKNGTQVRTLEELREHFDLESVLEYYFDGRLKNWLEQRFYKPELERLKFLLENGSIDPSKELCEIIGVIHSDQYQNDVTNFMKNREKLNLIKQFTNNQEVLQNTARVATSQRELVQILMDMKSNSSKERKVYLLGECFDVTENEAKIQYIGINNPTVKLIAAEKFDAKSREIDFYDVSLTADQPIRFSPMKSSLVTMDPLKIKTLNEYKHLMASLQLQEVDEDNYVRKIYAYNNTIVLALDTPQIVIYDLQTQKKVRELEINDESWSSQFTAKEEYNFYYLDFEEIFDDNDNRLFECSLYHVDLRSPREIECVKTDFTFDSFDVSNSKVTWSFHDKKIVLNMFRYYSGDLVFTELKFETTGKLISRDQIVIDLWKVSTYGGQYPTIDYGKNYYYLNMEQKLFDTKSKEVFKIGEKIQDMFIVDNKLIAKVERSYNDRDRNILVYDLQNRKTLTYLKPNEKGRMDFMKFQNHLLVTACDEEKDEGDYEIEIKLWDIASLDVVITKEINVSLDSEIMGVMDIDISDDMMAISFGDKIFVFN